MRTLPVVAQHERRFWYCAQGATKPRTVLVGILNQIVVGPNRTKFAIWQRGDTSRVLTHRHTLRTDLPPIYLKKTGFFQTQSSAFSKRSHRYGPSDGETSSQPPCRKSGDSAATATSAWCNAGRFSIDFPWFSMTIGSGSKRRQLIASGDDFFVRLRASQVTRSGLNSILRCLFDARL